MKSPAAFAFCLSAFLFLSAFSQQAAASNDTFNGTYNFTNTDDGSYLVSATVNGMTLDTINPVITVSPGQAVSGQMVISNSDPCSFCILPVVGINSWDRTFFSALGFLQGDNNFHQFTFGFSFTAPTVPGTYYISAFYRGCYAPADDVYGCYGLGDPRRGVPGGGDDIWDTANFTDWLPGGSFSSGRAIKVVVSAPQLPDLSIVSSLGPVQVVFNPDINGDGRIDLVKGKNTTFRVTAVLNDPTNIIPNNQPIAFNLSIGSSIITKTVTAGSLKAQIIAPIEFFFEPNETGNFTLNVIGDAFNQIIESNENNNVVAVNVSVKDTNNFLTVYKKIEYSIESIFLGPVNKYDETVGNGTLFINATYPINPQKFTVDNLDPTFSAGFPMPLLNPFLFGKFLNPGIDMSNLCVQGQLQTWLKTGSFNASVVVGIVSDNYFSSYGGKAADGGLSNSLTCGVLVRQGVWTGIAHEIGHLKGLPVNPAFNSSGGKEEYNNTYNGNPAIGLWVDRNQLRNNICFMGIDPPETLEFNWIDNEDYNHLFKSFALNPNDPGGLLVTGLIFRNGTVILGNWYSFANGTIDELPAGNFSIQTLDGLGGVINQTSFNVPFSLNFDTSGIVETNATSFAFKISFPQNTTSVRITFNNTILVEANPNSKSLRDAINSIPTFGFINNPSERRNALLNKLDAFDTMLKVNATQGAINKLKFDIRDKVEKWIIDYVPQNPLQLSKGFILDLIDRTISRLR